MSSPEAKSVPPDEERTNQESQNRRWVRIRVSTLDELPTLRNNYRAEILRGSLQRVDSHNLIIDGIVPSNQLEKLMAAYVVQELGDPDALVREASTHVSGTNRYGNGQGV